MSILEVKNLSKKYCVSNGFLKNKRFISVLDGFNMTLDKGEIVGLVGNSGSGKSTIARSLVNLEEPDFGEIVIDGDLIFKKDGREIINRYKDLKIKKKIQIIMQDPYSSLNPKQKVGNIILDGLLLHNSGLERKEAVERVKKYFELVGLPLSFFYKYPHELSGGQRQRVSIARSLILEPDILICDEITSALDVSIQAQILNLMLDLKERLNLTYLFISHDMDVVECFCDRVIKLKKNF